MIIEKIALTKRALISDLAQRNIATRLKAET